VLYWCRWLKLRTLYRRTGFSYMFCMVFCVCCTLCCTSLSPLRQGEVGGRGLAIADSYHKLGALLGSSRGYILPAGWGEVGGCGEKSVHPLNIRQSYMCRTNTMCFRACILEFRHTAVHHTRTRQTKSTSWMWNILKCLGQLYYLCYASIFVPISIVLFVYVHPVGWCEEWGWRC
jgi:hypothetical protein